MKMRRPFEVCESDDVAAMRYDAAAALEPGEQLAFGANKLSSAELRFVFERCMADVVQHADEAGYGRPVTAREMPQFLSGYYAHLQRKKQITWGQVPGLLNDLDALWHAEIKTN